MAEPYHRHMIAYDLPPGPYDFPFRGDGEVCHRGRDGSNDLEFRWLQVDAETLRAHQFRPIALGDRLAEIGKGFQHMVVMEENWQ